MQAFPELQDEEEMQWESGDNMTFNLTTKSDI